MKKLDQNIKRILAIKALKDIRKIVENEEQKEKLELRGAIITITLFVLVISVIFLLKAMS